MSTGPGVPFRCPGCSRPSAVSDRPCRTCRAAARRAARADGPAGDAVVDACGALLHRGGARHLNIHARGGGRWVGSLAYRAVLFTAGGDSPAEVAYELTAGLLAGAVCRCGRTITLLAGRAGDAPGCCRWELAGGRWVAGCGVDPAGFDRP